MRFTAPRRPEGPERRDHPRSRGVYVRPAARPIAWAGSSPLARGLPGLLLTHAQSNGIIPARAGFTTRTAAAWRASTDHPRSRGVYAEFWDQPQIEVGSSPLARGLPNQLFWDEISLRIIPARAGFTDSSSPGEYLSTDHPRSRGVYLPFVFHRERLEGSSPLARGLPPFPVPCDLGRRIIPARAGFTSRGLPATAIRTDHPRSRGVYVHLGSSRLVCGGIIPARAGFTDRCSSSCALSRDHPRSRGVYLLSLSSIHIKNGSSPLARGLRASRAQRCAGAGIIPARAGFTTEGTTAMNLKTDHPRSRGVYSGPVRVTRPASGSSPLARGLPYV